MKLCGRKHSRILGIIVFIGLIICLIGCDNSRKMSNDVYTIQNNIDAITVGGMNVFEGGDIYFACNFHESNSYGYSNQWEIGMFTSNGKIRSFSFEDFPVGDKLFYSNGCIYYRSTYEKMIVRFDLHDTRGLVRIENSKCEKLIGVTGDTAYYVDEQMLGIHTLNCNDPSPEKILAFDHLREHCALYNSYDDICFLEMVGSNVYLGITGSNCLFAISIDSGEISTVFSASETEYGKCSLIPMCVTNHDAYVMLTYSEANDMPYSVIKIPLNNESDPQILSDYLTDAFARGLCIYDGWLYYYDSADKCDYLLGAKDAYRFRISKCNLSDENNNVVVVYDKIIDRGYFCPTPSGILYYDADKHGVYICSLDGKNTRLAY